MIISKKKIIASAMALSLLAGGAATLQPIISNNVDSTAIVADAAVSKKNIKNATVTLKTTTYTYNGGRKMPEVMVKLGNKTLIRGTDYNVSYSNNINAGTATAKITGKGAYTGTVTRKFTIKKANASTLFKKAYASISATYTSQRGMGECETTTPKKISDLKSKNTISGWKRFDTFSVFVSDKENGRIKSTKVNCSLTRSRDGKTYTITFSPTDTKNYTGSKTVTYTVK